jgi:uncharacterized membrane protein (DUF106 family)
MLEQASNSTLYLILIASVLISFVTGFVVKFIVDRRTRKNYRAIDGELEVKRVRYKKLRNDFQQLQTEMDHQRVELHKLIKRK